MSPLKIRYMLALEAGSWRLSHMQNSIIAGCIKDLGLGEAFGIVILCLKRPLIDSTVLGCRRLRL